MKRTLTAAALIITTAIPATAMQQELNALTGALFNDLSRMQMDVGGMSNLTIADINRIVSIQNSGDTESEKRSMINNILRKAGQ